MPSVFQIEGVKFVMSFVETLLWFCLSVALAAFGTLVALIGMWLNYFRGTQSGRTSLVCAILTAFSAFLLWLICALFDPPCSMIFAVCMSLATFMAFASWFSRYDRH